MDNKLLQMDYILNLDKFQKIQDDIAKATDMAVITIDYLGNPITKHSGNSAFCTHVRSDSKLCRSCEKCDSRGGLEAARNKEAYIYRCHMGVVDFALPIIVDGQYLGALMAGQVRLENEENNQELEWIVSRKYQVDLDQYPDLKSLYDQLPAMKLEKIEAVAHMMHHLINYIVGEAVLKTLLYEANQKLTDSTKEHTDEEDDNQDDIQHYYPTEVPEDNGDDVRTEQVEQTAENKSILLKPALDYIDQNYDKKIHMDKMAYLCNISTSYFSKIFKRETGYNFSTYINDIKIVKAKELLETTTSPVINISLDLGYDDCGYFIKVFKKKFGMTPATYRKEYRKKLN